MDPLYLALLIMNVLCFFLMWLDKHRACRKMRRISEKVLFLSALAFGSLGGCFGMILFRHKTRHTAFRIGFPLILLVQILVFCLLLS